MVGLGGGFIAEVVGDEPQVADATGEVERIGRKNTLTKGLSVVSNR